MNEERRYRIGVWIVIASEALLFAGLFALYASYRSEYTAVFERGVEHDIQWIGGVNTFVLLTSSFAIAYAIHLVRAGRVRGATWSVACVLALGLAFLALKILEWVMHIGEGIVPGIAYHGPDARPGMPIFFTLYYGMTGLHALHVIAGLALVTWVFVRLARGTIVRERMLALELVALYWHFVDAIWVFLWPMFYLMHAG